MTRPLHLTKEKLESLYAQENVTVKAIAVTLGCAPFTVHDYLTRFGIQRRPKSVSARLAAQTLWQSEDTEKLARMKAKIGEKSRLFWKNNPEKREQTTQKVRRLKYHKPDVMQEIKTLYDQGMNTCDIAKKFNVTKSTVIRAMHIQQITMKQGPARYAVPLTLDYTSGYILGVIYGDGFCFRSGKHHRVVIGLNTVDKSFLECFSFHLCKLLGRSPLKIKIIKTKDTFRQPYFRGICSSEKLFAYIKSLNYGILAQMLAVKPFRIGFLRGFFDSEGCIYFGKNILKGGKISKKHPQRLRIVLDNTDKPLLELVKNALTEENILSWGPFHEPMFNRWNKNQTKTTKHLELEKDVASSNVICQI